MRTPNKGEYRSRVYTDRPDYADLDSAEKFSAILGIIMTRLRQHPNAICSYSGGADSDIMIDLIETARKMLPLLPPVKYVFFNTGLEMKATRDHVKQVAEKYDVEIVEERPKVNIVKAVRTHGVPFVSKIMSQGLPSAQPEHNYCRECKWSRCHINADKYGNTETYWRCIYWCGETDEEGFCYNWERRTDETDRCG